MKSSQSQSQSEELDFLKHQYNELKKEFEELQNDYNKAKKDLNKTHEKTLVDDLVSDKKNKEIIISLRKKNQNINNESRLALYELVSGIYFDNTSMEYVPVGKKDKKITDTSWFRFEADANVDKIGFQISYISNQDIRLCYQDKMKHWDIKKLKIKMDKQIHQAELKESLDYFSNNPLQIGLAFSCIDEYSKLFYQRRRISKTLYKENPELIKYNLIIEDEVGYLEILATSQNTKRDYFKIQWKIMWDEKKLGMKDFFYFSILYEDEDFHKSVKHNFIKLVELNRIKVFLYEGSDHMDRIEAKLYNHNENEKLKFLRKAMLAVKAAEAM